jgi:hypothetical protein
LQAFNAYEPNYDRLDPMTNRSAEDYRKTAEERGGKVKFAYLSPDFANPTGETLDEAGRQRLLGLADELDCAVIEDGAYQSLRYDGTPVPPVLALDCARSGGIENTRTLYCGSFSKTLSPGLRLGWVCAAKDVISRLVLLKQAGDLHSSSLNQEAMARVAETVFDAQVDKVRSAYRERRDAMLAALENHMPAGTRWTRPEGGMFVWVELPEVISGCGRTPERGCRNGQDCLCSGQGVFRRRKRWQHLATQLFSNDAGENHRGHFPPRHLDCEDCHTRAVIRFRIKTAKGQRRMDLTDQLNNYCERLGPEFWSEPVNAITNAAFVVAALAAYLLWRRKTPDDWVALFLICVVLATGIGSFLFHTFATRWALLADVIPIVVFIHGFLLFALRRFLNLHWVISVSIVIGFFVLSPMVGEVWAPLIGSSAGYLPALLAIFVVGGFFYQHDKALAKQVLLIGAT